MFIFNLMFYFKIFLFIFIVISSYILKALTFFSGYLVISYIFLNVFCCLIILGKVSCKSSNL